MSSKPGIEKVNWCSLEGWLLKGIIVIYYKKKWKPTKEIIAECLRRHVSQEDIETIVGGKVNDNMIKQRGHKGQLEKNKSEWPDVHPDGVKMWPHAQRIVAEKRKLTLEEIRRIAMEELL